MMCCRVLEFPAAVGQDAPRGENDYLHDATILLRKMAVEIGPLASQLAGR